MGYWKSSGIIISGCISIWNSLKPLSYQAASCVWSSIQTTPGNWQWWLGRVGLAGFLLYRRKCISKDPKRKTMADWEDSHMIWFGPPINFGSKNWSWHVIFFFLVNGTESSTIICIRSHDGFIFTRQLVQYMRQTRPSGPLEHLHPRGAPKIRQWKRPGTGLQQEETAGYDVCNPSIANG